MTPIFFLFFGEAPLWTPATPDAQSWSQVVDDTQVWTPATPDTQSWTSE